MENASKALLMAGAVLISILIFTLMATLFLNAKEVFGSYEETKKIEAIEQFNVNFTKYLGENLNIYQVVTICNCARENNVTGSINYTVDNIEENINKVYSLQITNYSNGYVKSISFTEVNN